MLGHKSVKECAKYMLEKYGKDALAIAWDYALMGDINCDKVRKMY